mmetsp:Transcript_4917/g.5758  ORF Transcript_4917/g.5758 Transcript_4917/m.5758 type:complete len:300 (-) Transcript_4917:256-1155(-)
MQPITVAIGGNIGAGKSSILRWLQFCTEHPVFLERWWDWIVLSNYYNNQEKYATQLQGAALRTAVEDYKTAMNSAHKGIVIFERAPIEARQVFWEHITATKQLPQEEVLAFEAAYQAEAWNPDIYILLAKPAEICQQHIKSRGQPGDANMELDYLKELENNYIKMMEKMNQSEDAPLVLCVDSATEPEKVQQEVKALLTAISLKYNQMMAETKLNKPQRQRMIRTMFRDESSHLTALLDEAREVFNNKNNEKAQTDQPNKKRKKRSVSWMSNAQPQESKEQLLNEIENLCGKRRRHSPS